MRVERDILHLPEGDKYAEVTKFSNSDCKQLKVI